MMTRPAPWLHALGLARPGLPARLAGLAASALLLAAAPGPAGAAEACTLTERQFSDQIDALGDWPAIHAHVARHFPPCVDEGLHAQAHTELVVRTLVAAWTQLPDLARLSAQHPGFQRFVLRHVNAGAGRGDLQTILTYATIRCPRGQGPLCQALRASAAEALQALQ